MLVTSARVGDGSGGREEGAHRIPCRQEPDLWFSDEPAGVECAKRRCRGCPLLEACLTGALARQEPWGVWGGQLVVDGAVVARKRGRGRPRKDQAAA